MLTYQQGSLKNVIFWSCLHVLQCLVAILFAKIMLPCIQITNTCICNICIWLLSIHVHVLDHLHRCCLFTFFSIAFLWIFKQNIQIGESNITILALFLTLTSLFKSVSECFFCFFFRWKFINNSYLTYMFLLCVSSDKT